MTVRSLYRFAGDIVICSAIHVMPSSCRDPSRTCCHQCRFGVLNMHERCFSLFRSARRETPPIIVIGTGSLFAKTVSSTARYSYPHGGKKTSDLGRELRRFPERYSTKRWIDHAPVSMHHSTGLSTTNACQLHQRNNPLPAAVPASTVKREHQVAVNVCTSEYLCL